MTVLIEWIDGGTLQRGTLKKEDKSKLAVVSLLGRSLSVAAKRFFIRHETSEEPDAYFEAIDRAAGEVDLELLHDEAASGGISGGKGRGEFSLENLAGCWFSAEKPSARERSILLAACLDGAPWFRVDASGRVRAAGPKEIERWRGEKEARQREEAKRAELEALFRAGTAGSSGSGGTGIEIPEGLCDSLLRRLRGEEALKEEAALFEAVEAAARESNVEPRQLIRTFLAGAGRLPEPYILLMDRFHRILLDTPLPAEPLPAPGRNIYPEAPVGELDRIEAETTAWLDELPPPRNGTVFSVDDEGVQEIDDAISAESVEGGKAIRAAVHIAAPGLLIDEKSAVHRTACRLCTTVYQPELKWTMLPLRLIELFSLKAGRRVPAVSTYFTFAADSLDLLDIEVRLEALEVAKNFTYSGIESELEGGFFPELELLDSEPDRVRAWLDRDPAEFPWSRSEAMEPEAAAAVDLLVPLARRLFVNRCHGGARLFNRTEYRIKVADDGTVDITKRERNSLAEGIVSELMILTNSRSAARLSEAGVPAIYRTQRLVQGGASGGAKRMRPDLTVNPREHAGLGSAFYCWITSPLRRYADLINQRQMGSLLGGRLPAFGEESELLIRAKKMEYRNELAMDHQKRLERYWTLKYLESLGDAAHPVVVDRRFDRTFVRFAELPFSVEVDPGSLGGASGAGSFRVEQIDYHELRLDGSLVDE